MPRRRSSSRAVAPSCSATTVSYRSGCSSRTRRASPCPTASARRRSAAGTTPASTASRRQRRPQRPPPPRARRPVETRVTEIWRMGANPVSVTETGEIARRLEADGWDGFAVAEAHGILPDPYAVLALAAFATTTLKLGTAVAVPIRHPILAAGAMATIQAVSGGRARFGVGRGDSAVKLLHQAPMKVAEVELYLSRLQGYLKREDVDIDGNLSSM